MRTYLFWTFLLGLLVYTGNSPSYAAMNPPINSTISYDPPPVELGKMRTKKKKKRIRGSKKIRSRQQTKSTEGFFLIFSLVLLLSGIGLFIAGLVLLNPWFWIIGLGLVFLAFLGFILTLYLTGGTRGLGLGGGLFAIIFGIIGLLLLIVGLVFQFTSTWAGAMALWIGGIVFLLPFLLGLFLLLFTGL